MTLHSLVLYFTIITAFVSQSVLSQERESGMGGNVGSECNIGARSSGSVGTGDASGNSEGYGGVSGNSDIGGKFGSNVGGMNNAGSVGGEQTNEINRNSDSNQGQYPESQGNNNNTRRTNV